MITTNGRNSPFQKFTIILGLASIIGLNSSQAQETATPVQSGAVSEPAGAPSDFEVEIKALEMTTPMPASELPDSSEWHGFYSVQNLDWPPLPADILGLPVWPLGDGFFALDDTSVNYAELAQAAQPETTSSGQLKSKTNFSPD
jgi:hypothetical protein